jgi:hypothetical protein
LIKLNPCAVISKSLESINLICSQHPELNMFERNIESESLIPLNIHDMEFNLNSMICKYFDCNNNEMSLNDLSTGDFVVPIVAIHGFNHVTNNMSYEIVQLKEYKLCEPKLHVSVGTCMYNTKN